MAKRIPGLYRRGNIWWAKYYVNDRPVRESTGTEKETEAKRFLETRRGRAAAGMPMLPRAEKVSYLEAAADLRTHYATSGKRDVKEAETCLRRLERFFRGYRLVHVSGAEIQKYVAVQKDAGLANGTINRDLATFSRMLRHAYENGKLTRLPVIRKLKEAAPRQGSSSASSSRPCADTCPRTSRSR